ncbi:Ku protein [Thermocrispum municipale]|uniref:non-homologous end joining protein Ku n=1 Tax=Thermocrispum municipale TaxID=37926 RepID=UPI00048FE737|nr:Ku protein [Thermocrispum municipale]
MRAMWKGSISFGLVTIPIKLYAATETKNVSFRQVHAADGGRIQYKRVCTICGEEVPYSDIAKGYELSNGDMVVLDNDDLAGLPLASTSGIDVLEFVPLESVDPMYYDRGYYLEPDKGAAKPYVLLRDALHKSGRVAIVKVALRQRETLALLRVWSDVLVLQTMLWPDEVRAADFDFLHEDLPEVRQEEMSMAGMLIDSLSEEVFEPDKFHDDYREAVLELVDAKAEGQTITQPAKETTGEVVDLMAALQASVEGAKKGSAGTKPSSSDDEKPAKAGKRGGAKKKESA